MARCSRWDTLLWTYIDLISLNLEHFIFVFSWLAAFVSFSCEQRKRCIYIYKPFEVGRLRISAKSWSRWSRCLFLMLSIVFFGESHQHQQHSVPPSVCWRGVMKIGVDHSIGRGRRVVLGPNATPLERLSLWSSWISFSFCFCASSLSSALQPLLHWSVFSIEHFP